MSKINHKNVLRGAPLPRGASICKDGVNFSIFSRHAAAVTLVIQPLCEAGSPGEKTFISLNPRDHRTGDMWHVFLKTDTLYFTYGYQIRHTDGKTTVDDPILLDPYARSLLPRSWGKVANYGKQPSCKIESNSFDWQGDRPLKIPLADTIIYELHLKGFTQNSNSGVSKPGTYLGLIEKIPYLQELGITAVELMPITEFDENDNFFSNPDTGEKLRNYWGYNPVSFFAINSGYASNPDNAVTEFKTLVRELHKAGIEVFLDMVYNHTGEGGYGGNTSSFRGIDNSIYYLLGPDGQYHNFSGCGNTFNCNHPVVRDLIKESLQYWVTEMHIDGFRFDLASILNRDQQGKVLPNPPMIEIIGQDPVLRDTKMIAEAWDAAGLYQVGSFSTDSRWAEWNGKYRDDLRSFMLGKPGTVTHLATRLAGSSDLYETSGRSPLSSINFITSHDGFTLYDLVSYNKKHNRLNGEENRDGDNHNLSFNCGHEGETDDGEIQRLRRRKIKTFATLLFISQGIPMLLAGDEFARSQGGNNNAWCQDNETGWVDWSDLSTNRELFEFFRFCIDLRKRYKAFRLERFFSADNNSSENRAAISWQYLTPGSQNWNADCHGLAFHLQNQDEKGDHDFFFAINNGKETLNFTPPELQGPREWRVIIDTAQHFPYDFTKPEKGKVVKQGDTVKTIPFSCVLLQGCDL